MTADHESTRDEATVAGPLAGVRVIDLTHLIAGPFCTMQLADAGADVIKVEPPEGEISRHRVPARSTADGDVSAYFAAVNRGKRSVTIDLKDPEGQALLDRLLGHADVLVTNYRTAALERLGLNPHQVRDRYPSLIVATISAFGIDRATSAAGQPGLAIVAEAISGITALAQDRQGAPTWVGFALGDYVAGLTAYGAIVSALFERHRTAQGRYLDISMAESLLAFNGISLAGAMFHNDEEGSWSGERETPVPYGVYPTSDGHVAIGVNSDKFWFALCDAMGRQDLRADQRFSNQRGRIVAREEVNEIVSAWTSSMSKEDTVRTLIAEGVPAAPLNRPEDVIANDILAERSSLTPVNWGGQQIAVLPGPPMGFEPLGRDQLPRLGEHTAEVLAELVAHDQCGVVS